MKRPPLVHISLHNGLTRITGDIRRYDLTEDEISPRAAASSRRGADRRDPRRARPPPLAIEHSPPCAPSRLSPPRSPHTRDTRSTCRPREGTTSSYASRLRRAPGASPARPLGVALDTPPHDPGGHEVRSRPSARSDQSSMTRPAFNIGMG